jgi:transcriptional regulator with XRE-family HTH domain
MVADMSKRIALPAAIKAIREAKAASDTKYRGSTFAITCLMSHAHLCNIEAGRKQPPEDVIHRIAAHLGVPADAISYVTETEAVA